ncbi:MAG: transposase [Bacteroidia bacterium]|nr:transposase [Bacteroidia bacterium]
MAGIVQLTRAGKIVEEELLISEQIREDIFIDEYVIMPNHVHMIVFKARGQSPVLLEHTQLPQTEGFVSKFGPQRDNIPAFVRAFKSIATRKIRQETIPHFSWQVRYNDRIIRNQRELERTRTYIKNNPRNWDEDPENRPWE